MPFPVSLSAGQSEHPVSTSEKHYSEENLQLNEELRELRAENSLLRNQALASSANIRVKAADSASADELSVHASGDEEPEVEVCACDLVEISNRGSKIKNSICTLQGTHVTSSMRTGVYYAAFSFLKSESYNAVCEYQTSHTAQEYL